MQCRAHECSKHYAVPQRKRGRHRDMQAISFWEDAKTDRLLMYAPTVLLAAQNLQGHNTTNPTLLTEGTGSWDA